MARIFIPTRNRPVSLRSVITYLDTFFAGTEVIVADGSTDEFAELNAKAMRDPNLKTQVDYRKYPSDMPFFDRVLDVIENEPDEFFIMGSDDDYPLMNALNKAENLLLKDPEGSTALGPTLKLKLSSLESLSASLSIARPIQLNDPEQRARRYANWSFSTTYAVTRRTHLVERYKRARDVFLPGFYDFGVGLHDSFAGKVLTLNEFTYIATRNFNHSYLRAEDRLVFIRQSENFFKLLGYIEADFVEFAGMSPENAFEAASSMMIRRIQENTTSMMMQSRELPGQRVLASNPVKNQIKVFFNTFTAGTADRKRIAGPLRFVVDALLDVAQSRDNAGEATTYESLDTQLNSPRDQSGDGSTAAGARMFKTGDDLVARRRQMPPIPTEMPIEIDTLLRQDPVTAPFIHVLVLGQSNVANHGEGLSYSSLGRAVTMDGTETNLSDPVPGGSGELGSIWPRVSDLLAEQRVCDQFVVTLRAESGASVADWAENGKNFNSLRKEIARIARHHPPVTHIVWHQGERDTLNETSRADYCEKFRDLYELLTLNLPGADWVICRASHRMGVTSPNVIEAQNEILRTAKNAFEGPNTDSLGDEFRIDRTHFNTDGLQKFAALMATTLSDAVQVRLDGGVPFKGSIATIKDPSTGKPERNPVWAGLRAIFKGQSDG